MSISERLQMVIKMNGMTNASFADEIGVQRSSISHVLAGRNKPSIDFIQKILLTFPKVNADWLITGKKIGKGSEENIAQGIGLAEADSVQKVVDKRSEQVVQDEEQADYGNAKIGDAPLDHHQKNNELRKIVKVIVFYNDGTFEETLPRFESINEL